MNYPYSMSPYIQTAMAQAMQAIITGSPLPPNCMVVTIPIQQAQQMFPQLMMNYASGGGAMTFPQQPSYYDQLYQPQISPYQNQPLSNAVVPYSNYYSQGYNQPIVPYTDYNHKSKKKNRNGKNNRLEPHSNVYNSSSFDSDMDNLSWSRLFGTHNHIRHSKQQKQDQAALNYNQKYKRQDRAADSLTSSSSSSSSTTTSSSTTSDETIRRVNLSTKQPSSQSSSLKQQTKGSLPFKYSSEFVPGTGKQQQSQKSNKKETKVKYDDVFVVKKTQPPSSQQ
jgi:hypothetical protein